MPPNLTSNRFLELSHLHLPMHFALQNVDYFDQQKATNFLIFVNNKAMILGKFCSLFGVDDIKFVVVMLPSASSTANGQSGLNGPCMIKNSYFFICARLELFCDFLQFDWLHERAAFHDILARGPKELFFRFVYTTSVLGTARLNLGTRTYEFWHGTLNFYRVNGYKTGPRARKF